jgi:hypothetical protein
LIFLWNGLKAIARYVPPDTSHQVKAWSQFGLFIQCVCGTGKMLRTRLLVMHVPHVQSAKIADKGEKMGYDYLPIHRPARPLPCQKASQDSAALLSLADTAGSRADVHGTWDEELSVDAGNVASDAMINDQFSRLFAHIEQQQNQESEVLPEIAPAAVEVLPTVVTYKHSLSRYWKRAQRGLKSARNRCGAAIWSTRYELDQDDLRRPVERAIRKKKKLIILSGTHGDSSGMRGEDDVESVFYSEDIVDFDRRSKHGSPYVQVKDITRLTDAKLGKILTGNIDVVLAFCYSRNDVQVLRHLQWHPTVNCMPPEG